MYDIIVVGGGAAGMTAAIQAKQTNNDINILIIDKNKKLGKKLYATGNGKCNLANERLDLSSYYSANEFFPYEIVTTDGYLQVEKYMNNLGISSYSDEGYIYPASLQASSVVWAMTDRIRLLGIERKLFEEVTLIEDISNRSECNNTAYRVHTDKGRYEATCVIVAPGGAAAPKLGGSTNSYNMLNKLNINIIKPRPALVKLLCSDHINALNGVRAKANVSLLCDNNLYDRETGEVQFGEGYISGIAVFNLSIMCGVLLSENKKPLIEIELIPTMSYECCFDYLKEFVINNSDRSAEAMLNGLINEKIASYITEKLCIQKQRAGDLNEALLSDIAYLVKHLTFTITKTGTYDDSQATGGGVDTRQLCSDSLETYGHKGLFIAGEYADVTGKCGGYNIMWAILSGQKAGEAAGRRINNDKN